MTSTRRAFMLSGLAVSSLALGGAGAPLDKVKIGQATTSLSYLKIFAARALDTFAAEQVGLEWAQIPGGDPAALAAVDAGDLDLAAVGSDTALAAIEHGQPFQIVYTVISKVPYDLTVSKAFLAKSGVSQSDPLVKRIGVMKKAIIGASAIGGAQDRIARWLAGRGGLDPKALTVVLVGAPPALGAAMDAGRIDGFMLSPPQSVIAEKEGYGEVLVNINKEFPDMHGMPGLVLVAKTNLSPEARTRITRGLSALTKAGAALKADPTKVAALIQAKYFPKTSPAIILNSVQLMADGAIGDGRIDSETIAALTRFTTQSGDTLPKGNGYWTNAYNEAVAK